VENLNATVKVPVAIAFSDYDIRGPMRGKSSPSYKVELLLSASGWRDNFVGELLHEYSKTTKNRPATTACSKASYVLALSYLCMAQTKTTLSWSP
jgi:hypothetical protein